ncbi:MAG TPA: hypothetical protein VHG08_14485 [Longimicrobium sp.]|nr:hypothetical protein [Longimicrobium sp.]
MRSLSYNRRRSDEGYTPQRRSPLQVLRSLLRRQPPTESVQPLSHWRRRTARIVIR